MKAKQLVASAVLLSAVLFGFGSAQAQDPTTTVYVVHGINGEDFDLDRELPVDVWVSDLGCAISDFRFGDRIGPLAVPAGNYDIRVSLHDETAEEGCNGTVVIELDQVPLDAGANSTLIAHRTADGTPGPGDSLDLGITASPFANDFNARRGRARVLVQHTALAPSVDVVVSRRYANPNAPSVTVPGFSNPTSDADVVMSQINAELKPGRWEVTLEVDGAAVADPDSLLFRPGKSVSIFAVGDFFGGSFEYLVYVDDATDPNSRVERARQKRNNRR